QESVEFAAAWRGERGGGEEQQDEGKEEAAALPHPRILSRKDLTRHQPAPKVGVTCVARRRRFQMTAPPRARPRPSPQLRVLPVRQPPSSRFWPLLALPPWPLRARPCGRLHAPPSPPPRVRQPRSSLSQRLRALPASPPRARLFA